MLLSMEIYMFQTYVAMIKHAELSFKCNISSVLMELKVTCRILKRLQIRFEFQMSQYKTINYHADFNNQ